MAHYSNTMKLGYCCAPQPRAVSWLGQFCHQTNFPVMTGSLERVKTRSQGGSQPGTSLQFPAGSWLNKGRLGFTSHFEPTCLPSRFPALLPNHKQHSTFPFCSLKTTCSDVPQSHGDGVCTLHSGNSFIVRFLSHAWCPGTLLSHRFDPRPGHIGKIQSFPDLFPLLRFCFYLELCKELV